MARKLSRDDIISNVYNNLETGFGSIEKKEYNSKWSNQSYKIVKIEYDDVGNRTFKLEGLNKPYLRHEILKV